MWWGTEPDPGGSEASGSNEQQELNELKDQSEQQQKLIAQLKEMLRKTDQITTTASLEKAEKLTTTLSKMQSRAKKNKQKKLLERDDVDKPQEGKTQSQIDTPGKEKVNLLRKQLEENRVKLAERGKHQKGIEDKVTQLKAQLDDSQALVNQSLSNISFKDIKTTPTKSLYSIESSNEELFTIITEKDKHISNLNLRIEQLEANVLDLQENLKEKDSVIEARTKAITLMSEDLSRRGKSTLDMLDETKEQMRLMQNNFVKLEDEMKNEKQKILEELDIKQKHILELESNDRERNNSYIERINGLESELLSLKDLNEQLTNDNRLYSEQIAEKDKIIQELKISNEEESSKTTNKKGSKKGNKLKDVELETLRNENVKLKEQIFLLEKQSSSSVSTNEEIEKLTKQLDEMNKSMIKLKAQNKSKIKELQKQIDVFKKADDINAELLKMNAENIKLKQTIVELEEEKGNLQLNLVDYDSKSGDTNMQGIVTELKQKLEELEKEVMEKQKIANTIQEEKDKLSTEMENQLIELESLQKRITELSQMEAEHVKTQMTSAHLEEQIDQLKVNNEDLIQQVAIISKENIALHERIETIITEKQELNTKLENLIHENIDLVDRLEKLSAEKVSSAESIEIVESLTQQEKLEIEEFNQKYNEPDSEGIHELEQNPELNDSVTKLTEESAELMEKIELFTIERKEVMEKMENLTLENTQLIEKLKSIEQEKLQLEETYETLFDTKSKIEQELDDLKEINKSVENTNVEEQITYYKSLISDQEKEIIELKEQLTTNQRLLEEMGIEKATVDTTLQEIIKEKDEITQLLTENINKIKLYDEKISENTSLINDFINRIQHAQQLLDEKDVLISEIEEEKNHKDQENAKLKTECENKTQQIQTIIADFQTKYRELQIKIDTNNESKLLQNEVENLQKQCTALDNTNKEQLQRMKKIAAHLKKKTTLCEELEKELENHKQELVNVTVQKDELMVKIDDLTRRQQETQDVVKLQEDLRAKEQVLETQLAKQQEQEMIIENIEQEKNRYFNKNSELAESLSIIQNENQTLQVTIRNLSEQLQEKIDNLEESISTYRKLEDNLLKTNSHKDQLQLKIDELSIENRELLEQNKINNENIHLLQHQLNIMDEKYQKENSEQIENLEDINNKLKSQVAHLENELTKVHTELANEKEQLEKLEYESTLQYEEFDTERKKLLETNERLNQEFNNMKIRLNELENENKYLIEQNKEFNDEVLKLQTNIDMKITENEQFRAQIQVLIDNEQKHLNVFDENEQLKAQIQVFIHNEQKHLNVFDKNEQLKAQIQMYIDNEQKYLNLIEQLKAQIQMFNDNEQIIQQFKTNEEHYKKLITELHEQLSSKNEQYKTNEVHYHKVISDLNQQIQNVQTQFDDVKVSVSDTKNIENEQFKAQIQVLIDKEQKNLHLIEQFKNDEIHYKKLLSELHEQLASNDEQYKNNEAHYNKVISDLNEQLQNVHTQLDSIKISVQHVAEQEVSNIVQIAEESVMKRDEINPLLHSEPTQDDLNDKIKTLQFMLHDSEKTKEDVLEICQELLNEITWREYEKNQKTKEKTTEITQEVLQAIESEIITSGGDGIQKVEEHLQPSQPPQPPSPTGGEEIVTCKKAYKCFTEDENLVLDSEDNFWGSEEAKLEDVHIQNTNTAVAVLEAQIKDMEIERNQMLDEIKVLQTRSNKMLKKLKEFKEKNDKLTNQLNFGDLNMAIEDELKSQVTSLEKHVKELKSEKEKDNIERTNLLRQIEALKTSNERMIEKQENEVQILKIRNKELNDKINQLEWGEDEPIIHHHSSPEGTNNTDLEKQIIELNAKIHDLSIDNEEMQCLLEEQVELRKESEKKLAELRLNTDTKQLWEDYNILVKEKNNLALDLKNAKEMIVEKELEITNFRRDTSNENQIVLLERERNELLEKYNLLLEEIKTMIPRIDFKNLQDEYNNLQLQYTKINDELGTTISEKNELINQLNNLKSEHSDLLSKLDEKHQLCDELSAGKTETERKLTEITKTHDEEVNLLRTQYEHGIQELKNQLDVQKTEALETLKSSMATWATEVDKRGADVAESWKAHLDKREFEFTQLETILRTEIASLEMKYSTLLENKTEDEVQQSEIQHERQMLNQTIQNKVVEMENLNKNMEILRQENQNLTQNISELNDKMMYYQNEIESNTSVMEVKDAQIQQLTYELKQLQEKLNHYENRLTEITEKNDEIHDEKLKLTEYVENIERNLKENEIQIQNLNVAINMKNDDILKLKEEISTKEMAIENEQIEQLKNEVLELKNLISSADEKYIQLMKENQNQVEMLKLNETELSKKTQECNNLRQQLENNGNQTEMLKYYENELSMKTQEYNNLRVQLENNVPLREEEIIRLNEVITARENDLIHLQSQLDLKSQQCTELEGKLLELDYIVNEDTKQMSDLKDIIESQVLKIEKLKTTSQEDEETQEEEKASSEMSEKHVHFPETELVTQHYYERQTDSDDQLLESQEMDSSSELVSKAELEVALYMLHQRDVRCEELTVELMQLLEERDTLQLRLSNSIRMNEELRRRISPRKLIDAASTSIDSLSDDNTSVLSTPIRKSKSSEILIGATGAEIAKEATEEQEELSSHNEEMTYLENKLSELQSIDHRRDVTLKDEKEARHLQLSLLQQHRDLSMLPAEAAARLVDANYTLSRESESASTVLLNWLWGKSTPKINHL